MVAADVEAVIHTLGQYQISAAIGFGPRIIGLRWRDGPEFMARLDDNLGIRRPDGDMFRFRGGHRLWVSPESSKVSHAPDDQRCEVRIDQDRMTITGPVDVAGFAKQLEVTQDDRRLVVEHRLRWMGLAATTAAAWAITQLPLGGTAILPLPGRGSGLGADRKLVLWPYSRLDDARLSFAGQAVTIDARSGPDLKLGSGPSTTALGYLYSGHVFVKRFAPADDLPHADHGAVAQVFSNEQFCELESVGPLTRLEPGDELTHQELWEVVRSDDLASAHEVLSAE